MTKFTNQPDPIRFQTNCAILLTYYTNVPIKSLKRHRKTISKVSLIKIFRSNIYFHSFFPIQKTLTSKQWKFQSVFATFFFFFFFPSPSSALTKQKFFERSLEIKKESSSSCLKPHELTTKVAVEREVNGRVSRASHTLQPHNPSSDEVFSSPNFSKSPHCFIRKRVKNKNVV